PSSRTTDLTRHATGKCKRSVPLGSVCPSGDRTGEADRWCKPAHVLVRFCHGTPRKLQLLARWRGEVTHDLEWERQRRCRSTIFHDGYWSGASPDDCRSVALNHGKDPEREHGTT